MARDDIIRIGQVDFRNDRRVFGIKREDLRVVRIDAENRLLMLRGAVPGADGGYLLIRKAVAAKPVRVPQVEKPKGKK